MDLKEENILGEDIIKHWYYVSKTEALLYLIRELQYSKILDVGAGSGFFSHQLLKSTEAKEAFCLDIAYEVEKEDIISYKKSISFIKHCEKIDADLILMMDILEHVDNDNEFLDDYINKVPSGSYFLITVPAFSFLWSSHDIFLGHKRRYNLSQLERLVNSSGLIIKSISYYYAVVFPLALATRLVGNLFNTSKNIPKSQLISHHPIINRILISFCRYEIPFIKINKMFGLTIFCLAYKK